MNTCNCVSEIADPCGRRDSASQPTTVSTSSMLSTSVPSGKPRQSSIGPPSSASCAVVMTFVASQRCWPYSARSVATLRSCSSRAVRAARQPRIDEIVEASKLLQPVLPAKLVESRNTALAIALDVARGDVDIARLAGEPVHVEILQELRMIVQRERPGALAAHRQRPVRDAALAHRACRGGTGGRHDRYPVRDRVRIAVPFAVVDESGTARAAVRR
jgi:hypothetical protein